MKGKLGTRGSTVKTIENCVLAYLTKEDYYKILEEKDMK